MQSKQVSANDTFALLKTAGIPYISVEAVKTDIQINCEENGLKELIEKIKPEFLFYSVSKAIDLIGKERFKDFGVPSEATVYEYFTQKHWQVLKDHNDNNPMNDNLVLDIHNSELSRVGNIEVGFCKGGTVFGLKVTDAWYKKLEELVEVVKNAKQAA